MSLGFQEYCPAIARDLNSFGLGANSSSFSIDWPLFLAGVPSYVSNKSKQASDTQIRELRYLPIV